MDRVTLKEMGKRCRDFRKSLGYRQIDVAKETAYSIENISSFERGYNDNLMIFLWYVGKGMPIDNIWKGV